MSVAGRISRSICHASLGTEQLEQAIAFYQTVLATLNIDKVAHYEHAAAFGKGYPEFWIQRPFDQGKASVGNGTHIGFVATSKTQVDEFHRQAISLGAVCNGAPGPRADYGEPYYGCFVLDLDGNRIEASYWALSD
ncbi:VOC family protein [Thalassotalea sp. LPB0316]|uniref:VOC family protein n=1 Tax=Thalassotalea sp. LPB0316 TaxID=2769490 RepID=UPI0018675392|nr:VOC family protein [Thalassotalea sp. LPB0316]QOL26823.1 VOC family protein [Thalassotalea sp. LPB0316]